MGRMQKLGDSLKVLIQIFRPNVLEHSHRDDAVIEPTLLWRRRLAVVAKQDTYPILQPRSLDPFLSEGLLSL